jgi:type I restriction enzyme R subunit
VDAVGVCENDKTDSRPMDRKKSVSFEKLLQAISLGNIEPDVISSVAVRISRMASNLSDDDHKRIKQLTGDLSVQDLSKKLVDALNPDNHKEKAKQDNPNIRPVAEDHIRAAATKIIKGAVKPLYDPKLRNLLIELKKKNEQIVDHVSKDQVIEAGFSLDALDRAKNIIETFEKFIEDNKDEITALQILYSRPYKAPLRFEDLKELAEAIEKPPYLWNESQLWQAYAALDQTKVKGSSAKRILTDLVSIIRFAIQQDNELVPFSEHVKVNFRAWLAQQQNEGKHFSDEQLNWLHMIRDHIAGNLSIETNDFEYAPFSQEGGLGKFHQLFGEELNTIIEELNKNLAA